MSAPWRRARHGAAIRRAHRRPTRGVDTDGVARLAAADDPIAGRAWAEMVDGLAETLAASVSMLDPSAVVLGGGIARSGELSSRPRRAELERRLTFRVMPLLPARFANESGSLGAGSLAWDLSAAPPAPAPPAPAPPRRPRGRAGASRGWRGRVRGGCAPTADERRPSETASRGDGGLPLAAWARGSGSRTQGERARGSGSRTKGARSRVDRGRRTKGEPIRRVREFTLGTSARPVPGPSRPGCRGGRHRPARRAAGSGSTARVSGSGGG
ncbi:ROK family protein [Embleya sp. NPDC050154]|uniref:ROK family protein n=1 Tax=Embleya sp. NPDC050154 TaxID=3363988 RepID=UPI0037A30115